MITTISFAVRRWLAHLSTMALPMLLVAAIVQPGAAQHHVSVPKTATTPLDAATIDAYRSAGVNELGTVPILMYHTFQDEPTDSEWTRTTSSFPDDLKWLYEHDFYLIGLRDLLDNTIDVPLGKHPVVLTFDDASPRQFELITNQNGDLVPAPYSAVGILEAFSNAHPDFGRAGHFAITGSYCFADARIEHNGWAESCGPKLKWLVEHGYEVGNHTWTHINLRTATLDQLAEEIAQTADLIDEHTSGPGNLSRVLTLPYGEMPEPGSDGASFLENGVWWDSREYVIEGIVLVSGGSMYSPASSWWDPGNITRIHTDPTSLSRYSESVEQGKELLYTSDGDPETVTVPDPLPDALQNEIDPGYIASRGTSLVVYSLEETPASTTWTEGTRVKTIEDAVRLRSDPSTSGDIVAELPKGTPLTIISGPVNADDYTWWQVRNRDGTTGWVVDIFLAALVEPG